MKILLVIALLLGTAQAQENFYAKILSGPNFLQNTTTTGNKATYETDILFLGQLAIIGSVI